MWRYLIIEIFLDDSAVKNLPAMQETCVGGRVGFNLWVWKIPWRRKWQPTAVFLPGKSHGQRRLTGYSPRGRKEWDTTEKKSSSPPTAITVTAHLQQTVALCSTHLISVHPHDILVEQPGLITLPTSQRAREVASLPMAHGHRVAELGGGPRS